MERDGKRHGEMRGRGRRVRFWSVIESNIPIPIINVLLLLFEYRFSFLFFFSGKGEISDVLAVGTCNLVIGGERYRCHVIFVFYYRDLN